jgi:hypothetical protein
MAASSPSLRLVAQDFDLTAQAPQLGQFLARQPIMALTSVQLGLPHPGAQRLKGNAEIACNRRFGLAAAVDQTKRLRPKAWATLTYV